MLCAGYREKFPVQVEGGEPHRVKDEVPDRLRAVAIIWSRVKRLAQVWIDALRQPVLGSFSRRNRRNSSFAAFLLSKQNQKKEEKQVRLTRHNGRAGKHGVYNPKHNDRSFDVGNSEHIDAERVSQNIYWDCFNGYRTIDEQGDPDKALETFSDIERVFYKQQYTGFIEGQNERNAKTRHTERNRTVEQILANKKTCPEETVYQIGTMDEHISEELLLQVVTDFMAELDRRFGNHIHILDWALHMDESTPHIHERHVFDRRKWRNETKVGNLAYP